MRMQIYNWFGRWLKGDSKPVEEEPDTSPERDEVLFAVGGGSTVKSLRGGNSFLIEPQALWGKGPRQAGRVAGHDRACGGSANYR